METAETPHTHPKTESESEKKQESLTETADVPIDDEMQGEILAKETSDALEAVKVQRQKLDKAKLQLKRAKGRENAFREYLKLQNDFNRALKAYEAQPSEERNDTAEGIINGIILLLKQHFGERDGFVQAKLESLEKQKWQLAMKKIAAGWDRAEHRIETLMEEGDTERAKTELLRLIKEVEGISKDSEIKGKIGKDGSIRRRLESVKGKWRKLLE